MTRDLKHVLAGLRARDKASVAQVLNWVEDRRFAAQSRVQELLDRLCREHGDGAEDEGLRIGLTGPPGVGKSSLVARLGCAYRQAGRSVAVVAIDPTSVVSGGALLGDRARMEFDPRDRDCFMRSLSTRGHAGGLSYAVHSAVQILASAFDVVLVETTGVGQNETDIIHIADTVVLVVQPGGGDTLQFLKAGVMEIPDLFVVNKADETKLAQRALSDLKSALHTLAAVGSFSGAPPQAISTSARHGDGIEDLMNAISAHREGLGDKGRSHRRQQGDLAWSFSLFLRDFGVFGMNQLGGQEVVKRLLHEGLVRGSSPPAVVDTLGSALLRAIRDPDFQRHRV